MKTRITVTGKIVFEPENKTKKHIAQAEKKRTAMILFQDDMSSYYAWFLKKRFNIELLKPLRGSHITFINDWFYGIDEPAPNEARESVWKSGKAKYNGKKIDVELSLDYHTNGIHWWLIIPHDSRKELLNIRAEIGLGKPAFGFHMTIGHVVNHDKIVENIQQGIKVDNTNYIQSKYIQGLEEKGFIDFKERWKGN